MIQHQGHPHMPQDMPPIVTEGESMAKKTVTTLIMVAAFLGLAVLGWFAVEESRAPKDLKDVPLIKADTAPYKVEPSDPGGMEVPHQNREVFNMVSDQGESDEPEAINLREDATETVDPEVVKQMMAAKEREQSEQEAAEVAQLAAEKEEQAQLKAKLDQEAKEAEAEKEAAVTPEPVAQAEPEKAVAEAQAKPVEKEAEKVEIPVPASMSKPTYAASVKNPSKEVSGLQVTTNKSSVSGVAKGSIAVKIGAYSSQDGAEKGWQLMRKKHSSALSGLRSTIRRADLGEKGIFYRLYAGPFKSTDEAKSLCGKLSIKGCVVAKL